MTKLQVQQCELTYEGAFVAPALSLLDSPGKLCDFLLTRFEEFGCTSADLVFEGGDPVDRGVTCRIDELGTRVTLHGDRVKIHCENFVAGAAQDIATVLENLWICLADLDSRIIAKTHAFLLAVDAKITGATYGAVLNGLARAPHALPSGTETAVVYDLPRDEAGGYGPSSLVFNRSVEVEGGLQVSATLVYQAGSVKASARMLNAKNRLDKLLRDLGFEWIEN